MVERRVDFGSGRPRRAGRTLSVVSTDLPDPDRLPLWQRRVLPAGLLESGGLLRAPSRRSTRDWVVDMLAFAAAAIVGIALLAEDWSSLDTAGVVVSLVFGTAACLSLWLRRRHPVAVGIAAVGGALVSPLAFGAAILALFNCAIRGPRTALVLLTLVSLAAAIVYPALEPGGDPYPVEAVFGVLLTVVAVGWGLFARARRELIYSLRERAERLEAEQRLKVEQAREAERRRIAGEMHDVLAHRVSLLSVHAGALEFRPDAPPAEIAKAAAVIRASAHAALQELRDVVGVLREQGQEGSPEPPQPTLEALPALVEECRAAGMRVNANVDVSPERELAAALGRTAYRIVQEGLTNARKHAPGAAVEVGVSTAAEADLEVLVVTRRPVGISSGGSRLPGAGTGLIGLAERVALAGGELEHGPDADGNFVLRALLPWPT
jgi:signal transduction histidine kinase